MNDFNFTLADGLVFNDSIINGTSCYESAYVVVAGLDLIVVGVAALIVINLITLAYIIMKVDLI